MSDTLGRPATPKEVRNMHTESIPGFVFDAINNLLAKRSHLSVITLQKSKIVKEILLYADESIDEETIFNHGWLNIDSAYREFGWDVHLDSPGYNESYEPFFEFSSK